MPLIENIELEVIKSKIQELNFANMVGGKLASKKDDYLNHTDIKIEIGIDLKGIKKIRRNDLEANENYHWVELKNTAGYDGWLYAGNNKYIAFETRNWVAIVDKERIKEIVNTRLIKQEATTPIPYHIYKRQGREDSLTLIPTLDLFAVASQIIKKPKYQY